MTDEKKFRLHLIKGQAYTFTAEAGIRRRIFDGKGRRCRVITGLYIVHRNVWLKCYDTVLLSSFVRIARLMLEERLDLKNKGLGQQKLKNTVYSLLPGELIECSEILSG